jgi:hypothetical protein
LSPTEHFENYKIQAPVPGTNDTAFACAASTVPNIMIVEMIAANAKPMLFMIDPSCQEYASQVPGLRGGIEGLGAVD